MLTLTSGFVALRMTCNEYVTFYSRNETDVKLGSVALGVMTIAVLCVVKMATMLYPME